MSASNRRVKEYNTVHHLTSRIAHRVYFLEEEERNEFMEMMIRSAKFVGIELLGWCIMGNHFHILAYLPEPKELSDEEIKARYQMIGSANELATIKSLRAQMHDIGSFMKRLKQWFTVVYNHRHKHVGTLWEAKYGDRVIGKLESEKTRDCLAYIHLNPIRAAITDDFFGYSWSSLNAVRRGDEIAMNGMRLVYGDEMSDKEMLTSHKMRMHRMLESLKERRAMEIARKRAAGYEVPVDTLTSEAMIAQAAAQVKEVTKALVEIREEEEIGSREKRRNKRIETIKILLKQDPQINAEAIAMRMEIPQSSVYRYLRKL